MKRYENDLLGNGNTGKYERTINQSDLIIAYGLSFGESDAAYWQTLKIWLLDDKSNHTLAVYIYNHSLFEELNHIHYPIRIIEELDNFKRKFLSDKLKISGNLINSDLLKRFVVISSESVLNFKTYEESTEKIDFDKNVQMS